MQWGLAKAKKQQNRCNAAHPNFIFSYLIGENLVGERFTLPLLMIYDIKSNKKVKKWLLTKYLGKIFVGEKLRNIFQTTNNFPRRKFSPTKFSPIRYCSNAILQLFEILFPTKKFFTSIFSL